MTFRKDRLLAVMIAFIALSLFIPTLWFPEEASYYPQGILILIFLLCIPLWIKAKNNQMVDVRSVCKNLWRTRNLLYVVGAIVLLIAFMDIIGFYIELPFFIGFVMYRLGYRKKIPLLIISLGLTFVVYLLFSVMLKVQIPMGLLSLF